MTHFKSISKSLSLDSIASTASGLTEMCDLYMCWFRIDRLKREETALFGSNKEIQMDDERTRPDSVCESSHARSNILSTKLGLESFAAGAGTTDSSFINCNFWFPIRSLELGTLMTSKSDKALDVPPFVAKRFHQCSCWIKWDAGSISWTA